MEEWNSPALVAFGALVVFLLVVGLGWLMKASGNNEKNA
jgi:heme/copper-type cytochrome/quinol oxidase subunit 4